MTEAAPPGWAGLSRWNRRVAGTPDLFHDGEGLKEIQKGNEEGPDGSRWRVFEKLAAKRRQILIGTVEPEQEERGGDQEEENVEPRQPLKQCVAVDDLLLGDRQMQLEPSQQIETAYAEEDLDDGEHCLRGHRESSRDRTAESAIRDGLGRSVDVIGSPAESVAPRCQTAVRERRRAKNATTR